jgi:glutamate-ammonia-ligase adenylyltransferase
MSFASQITRSPRPFDAERAVEIGAAYPDLPAPLREVLAGAGGSSPYLHGLLVRERDWLRSTLDMPTDEVLPSIYKSLSVVAPNQLKTDLREAKRRVALYTAIADLGGVWSLEKVTHGLTEFADLATSLAAQSLVGVQIERGKLPGQGEDQHADCAGMVILAMGKMGAHELNYSSDIDLISLFDETRYDPSDYAEVRSVFVKVTRAMAGMLSDLTADGYVFRTDLRLRPDPAVTPVCLSMEAAERYY